MDAWMFRSLQNVNRRFTSGLAFVFEQSQHPGVNIIHKNRSYTVLEFSNNLWGLGTEQEQGYRLIVPARQATQAGGIDSLDSIPGLLTSLKILALYNFVFWITSCTVLCFICALVKIIHSWKAGGGDFLNFSFVCCKEFLQLGLTNYSIQTCPTNSTVNQPVV